MKYRLMLLLSTVSQIVAAQSVKDSLQIEGYYRSFQFNKPAKTLQDASLVFVLHGSGGSGHAQMEATAKLLNKTSTEKVLFVYPDGYKHYWNECRKASSAEANRININEEEFFESMIHYFKTKYNTSEKKVFVVGISGGGHMSYKLAITIPDKFRAATAIIANLPDTDNFDCVESKVAIPIMIVNGTDDPLNRYEGGIMQLGTLTLGNVRSTDRTLQYWAELAGYKGNPVMTQIPNSDPNDGKTIERYTYKEKGKPEVVLLKVIGGKHDYPNDIDVHVEAWEFFKRQL
jgi:polyhydroxybutyrate depolymerase